jgi:hypothetical protein
MMFSRDSWGTFVKSNAVLLSVLALVACSGDSQVMTSASAIPDSSQGTGRDHGSSLEVSHAAVIVNGVPVQGTVTRGTGESALFQVRVTASMGLAGVGWVVMQFSQPGPNRHGGPMMGGYNGEVFCYDDGTHGDDTPGDGIYHYMDPGNQIGCHGLDAPMGEYHYSFWAVGKTGQRSNTAQVTIVRR